MDNTEMIERIVENEARAKSNSKRLDEHDKQIKELSNVYVALTKVDDKVTNVESNVAEMKEDLKEMKEKPLKEYEDTKGKIKWQIISFILTIILIFLATKLGLQNYM